MTLRLYNTLTKQKETFEPVTPGEVKMYLCGPTVYKPSHIGHAVGPVIFDAFKKYLQYKGFKVTFIINITDVDDKLIVESEKQGISMEDLAAQVAENYFEAIEQLGVNSVDAYPRATDHIGDIIQLIQRLGEINAAYESNGDVYFDISACGDYGKLSHRKIEDQMEGTRELAGAGKRNTADFALWKKAGPDEIGWDSPWGRGRPGWHIECSAMSMKHLGETYDIHGGGMDLIFPHHENEIAQSETATCKPFVKYWMHNGLTRMKTKLAGGEVKAEKMSKSLGNIRTLTELFEIYSPQTIRFFLLSTHYRRPIDFSDDSVEATQKGMMNIYRLLDRVINITGQDVYSQTCNLRDMNQLAQKDSDRELIETVSDGQLRFIEALDDDFNTAGAIAVLFELTSAVNKYIDQQRIELQGEPGQKEFILEAARMITTLGKVIGILDKPLERPGQSAGQDDTLVDELVTLFIDLRAGAKKEKNFALADAIRDRLKNLSITLEDRPDGTTWRKD